MTSLDAIIRRDKKQPVLENERELLQNLPSYRTDFASDPVPHSKIWLISFTDIMGLMLTFFVMLFAMSELQTSQIKPNQALSQPPKIEEAHQNIGASQQMGNVDAISLNKMDWNASLDPNYIKSLIENFRSQDPLWRDITILQDTKNQRLILMLPEDLLFAKGSDRLTAEAQKMIASLGQTLARLKNGIEIVGHTDPILPVGRGEEFNWNLSLSRASQVAELLKQKGYKGTIPVQGLASQFYNSETNTEKTQALARRVDIIIQNHDGSPRQRFGFASP
jgi:chemotaxis protein MotB